MAGDVNGKAYALTALCPIRDGHDDRGLAFSDVVRDRLQGWNYLPNSPMVKVPGSD